MRTISLSTLAAVLVVARVSSAEDTTTKKLVLGALLPISGSWRAGRTAAGALPIAVDKVNADPSLLPGHVLSFIWRDDGCNALKGLQQLTNLTSTPGH